MFSNRLQLDKYKDDDFKKPLQVFFHNEEGLDAGGLRKEFFLLLTKEILSPKYGMFSKKNKTEMFPFVFFCRLKNKRQYRLMFSVEALYEETGNIWFTDYLDDELEPLYKLIGVCFSAENLIFDLFPKILIGLIFRRFARWLFIM